MNLVIESDNVIFFDVDDTLVLWNWPTDQFDKTELFDNYGVLERLLPHFKHIDQLKKHKANGHKIVVWSAAGYQWAWEVVNKLGIDELVDLVMAKPQWYYDDLQPHEILPPINRVYFDPKNELEQTNSGVQE